MRARYGKKVRFVVLARRRPLLGRLGFPGVAELFAALDARALWARFGLAAR
jgi:serine protease SohB